MSFFPSSRLTLEGVDAPPTSSVSPRRGEIQRRGPDRDCCAYSLHRVQKRSMNEGLSFAASLATLAPCCHQTALGSPSGASDRLDTLIQGKHPTTSGVPMALLPDLP